MACFAGCASIAGLDGITEKDCAPNCGTVDSGVVESGPGQDTGSDTSVQGDTTMGNDSTADTSSADTGSMETSIQDSQMVDTFVWDGPPFMDSPFDSGCGDLNTTAHCGACPDTCASTGATQTAAACCSAGICPGSTNGSNDICQYTCANGYLDCNGSIPPNTDGCECHAPGATAAQCCATVPGGDCPIQHTDGLTGQSYYPASPLFWDCVPAGTMNSQLAQDACNDYVVARGGPANFCTEFVNGADSSTPSSWCSATMPMGTGFMGDCICWSFFGQYAGQVFDPQVLGASPATDCWYGTSPTTWN